MTYEDFITWVKHELTARGWSQSELARRGGITQSHMSRVLSGERPPGQAFCRAMSRAFGVPLEQVFRQAGILPKTTRHVEGVEELLDAYANLDPQNRKRLLRIARALREDSAYSE
ncbi:MAG: helix-turn-helix domain-containing protein [Armatimonadota bacterium]